MSVKCDSQPGRSGKVVTLPHGSPWSLSHVISPASLTRDNMQKYTLQTRRGEKLTIENQLLSSYLYDPIIHNSVPSMKILHQKMKRLNFSSLTQLSNPLYGVWLIQEACQHVPDIVRIFFVCLNIFMFCRRGKR